ncbi:MAG: redoxin family protein [Patescibacteria group bacterium]
MGTKNTTLLVIVICSIVGAILYLQNQLPARISGNSVAIVPFGVSVATSTSDVSKTLPDLSTVASLRQAEKSKKYPLAKEIVSPTGFINTDLDATGKPLALTIQSLIGKKVILLDIWTYSCINCQRTLPYLKSWYDKYKDQGLEIIGLHVPEFEFEKDYANVSAAVKKFGITYPVVLDSNASTARAYGMQYWPEEYLIDIDGFIVHKSIGEGGYEEKENKIVELLNERMKVFGLSGQVKTSVTKIDELVSPRPESPETYFGSDRNQYLSNGVAGKSGVQSFSLPKTATINALYLGGDWDVQPEFAENKKAGATIEFRYKAQEVYFVASSLQGAQIKIYQDGVLVTDARGEDVAADSTAQIKEDRLYKLIKNKTVEEHTLKIEMESSGLDAYTFTFG